MSESKMPTIKAPAGFYDYLMRGVKLSVTAEEMNDFINDFTEAVRENFLYTYNWARSYSKLKRHSKNWLQLRLAVMADSALMLSMFCEACEKHQLIMEEKRNILLGEADFMTKMYQDAMFGKYWDKIEFALLPRFVVTKAEDADED